MSKFDSMAQKFWKTWSFNRAWGGSVVSMHKEWLELAAYVHDLEKEKEKNIVRTK